MVVQLTGGEKEQNRNSRHIVNLIYRPCDHILIYCQIHQPIGLEGRFISTQQKILQVKLLALNLAPKESSSRSRKLKSLDS